MDEPERQESGLVYTLERAVPAGVEGELSRLVAAGWHGRVSELGSEALRAFWVEAVGYARWQIGRYACWRKLDEPVLADGYDAEGVVQAAFERLLHFEAKGVPIFYSAKELRHELRMSIKHRVRWLHERSETRLVVSEWDVEPKKRNAVSEWDVEPKRKKGEGKGLFDYLPGPILRPDEDVMRREKEGLLGEFKAGFEATLMKRRQELVEVFRRVWEGQRGREIAEALGTGAGRAKALRGQVRRRLARFGAAAQGGMAEMLEGVRRG